MSQQWGLPFFGYTLYVHHTFFPVSHFVSLLTWLLTGLQLQFDVQIWKPLDEVIDWKCCIVYRNFKLILHRNTDVFSSDFRASVVDEENRQQNVDVEREFYQGFEECKFSILFGTACLSQTFQDIAFAVFPQMLLKQMPQFLIFPCICHFWLACL